MSRVATFNDDPGIPVVNLGVLLNDLTLIRRYSYPKLLRSPGDAQTREGRLGTCRGR